MNQKELRELIEFILEKDIAEFELERGDLRLRIRRAGEMPAAAVVPLPVAAPAVVPAAASPHPAGPEPVAAASTVPAGEEEGLHIIQSPIVGTFYEAPSPGSPPFVKPGDVVEAGQVLCIIEAMKLMNEIESDVAGEIVRRQVNNGQPVEYGQPLFAIRPRA